MQRSLIYPLVYIFQKETIALEIYRAETHLIRFLLYCQMCSRIDHFLENHRKALGLFRTLLRHPASSAVRMRRLVEIMAINMFEIENLASEGSYLCMLYSVSSQQRHHLSLPVNFLCGRKQGCPAKPTTFGKALTCTRELQYNYT